MSHEMINVAEAEAVDGAEGNMCGTAMQGSVALPRSEATSRTKGSRRNLGDLAPPTAASGGSGPRREAEEAKPSRKGRGVGRGSSTCEAPEQGWDDQRRRAWREGPRSEGGRGYCDRRRTQRRNPSDKRGPRPRPGTRDSSRTPVTFSLPRGARCGKAARRDLMVWIELATVALANYDARVRFETRAARGNPSRALTLLDKLDLAD